MYLRSVVSPLQTDLFCHIFSLKRLMVQKLAHLDEKICEILTHS